MQINESSGQVIDKIEGSYINVANYESLLGTSYIQLLEKSRNAKKCLINIKNKDHKYFLWCHIRLINPGDSHSERIKKEKKIVAKLNYSNIYFPLNINNYELVEDRFNMNVNVFGYEDEICPFLIYY